MVSCEATRVQGSVETLGKHGRDVGLARGFLKLAAGKRAALADDGLRTGGRRRLGRIQIRACGDFGIRAARGNYWVCDDCGRPSFVPSWSIVAEFAAEAI
jgi:hypothetical protein